MKDWIFKKKLVVGLLIIVLLSLVVPWPGRCNKVACDVCPAFSEEWCWRGPVVYEVLQIFTGSKQKINLPDDIKNLRPTPTADYSIYEDFEENSVGDLESQPAGKAGELEPSM